MAKLVTSSEQVVENISTRLRYRAGTAPERKFHDRRVKNGKLFVAMGHRDGYAFAPSKFAGYASNNIMHENKLQNRDGRQTNVALTKMFGAELDKGDKGYDVIDRAFLAYCFEAGIQPSRHHRPRRYWLVSATIEPSPPEPSDAIDDLGSDNPSRSIYTGVRYSRDPKIREAVRRRAKGKCEFCGEAGFICIGGELYLECHHIIAMANDGADRLTNVIALCPKDHREAHFGQRRIELESQMIQKLESILGGQE
jgi:HNH endonuclease